MEQVSRGLLHLLVMKMRCRIDFSETHDDHRLDRFHSFFYFLDLLGLKTFFVLSSNSHSNTLLEVMLRFRRIPWQREDWWLHNSMEW